MHSDVGMNPVLLQISFRGQFNTHLDDHARFEAAVANYSTTILVGSVTEPLSVATQNAVTRNKSNTKTNLRNDRYRIWAQRKVGMLLGIQ